MATSAQTRTPIHVWIVGVLSLLWGCFGGYDYTMTRMRNTDDIASSMPGVDPHVTLAWVDSMPLYAQVGWGLGVWMGILGAVLLLVRSRWAVWAYGLSLVGAVLSLGYQLVLAPPLPGASTAVSKTLPIIIILVALALFLYARAMEKKGVLS
jgi:hypothetical protein